MPVPLAFLSNLSGGVGWGGKLRNTVKVKAQRYRPDNITKIIKCYLFPHTLPLTHVYIFMGFTRNNPTRYQSNKISTGSI